MKVKKEQELFHNLFDSSDAVMLIIDPENRENHGSK